MKKQLLFVLTALVSFAVWSQDNAVLTAHSQMDWDAAGDKKLPAQGFRNWEFGYYAKVNDPASFKHIPRGSNNYWGDGNFTYGAINKNEMCWSTHRQKFNVVRRWTVPQNGHYIIELTGKHALKINGKEVSWGRKFFVFVNTTLQKELTFPGQKFGRETLTLKLKKGDKIDFAADRGGSLLQITIQIKMLKKGIPVITNGQSVYKIVIPQNDPGAMSRKAAELLQRVIAQSTQVTLPVIQEEAQGGKTPAFYIGHTKRAQTLGVIPADLKEEEYLKKLVGTDIFIIGNNTQSKAKARGARHWRPGDYKAVVSFLENEFGARFLLPGQYGEYIPQRTSYSVPADLNVRHCPPFPYHVTDYNILLHRDAYEPYITAQNSLDNYDMYYWYGHSYVGAVPASKYGKTHPEYFVLQNGRRRPDKIGNQLCLSNPFVRAQMKKTIAKAFDNGFEYYQLCQSDGFFPCECEACKKLGDANHRVWDLHREIAAELYPRYPKCKINILAYDVSQNPPAHIKSFPPNVVIELSKYDEAEFKKWERFHVPHMVYDYNWGSFNEMGYLPKFTPARIADQLKRFKKYGVICIFNCGGSATLRGLDAPSGYVYGRMLDDLSLNPDQLVRDYCRAAFGENAAALMSSFFFAMYKYLNAHPENAYFTEDNPYMVRTPEAMISAYLPPATIRYMEIQLKQAENVVTGTNEKIRLQHVRLHFDYVKSVVKALAGYRLFQLAPTRAVFATICTALREREAAIKAIFAANLPASWTGGGTPQSWKTGGVLSGKLGAPFSWDYQKMEKSGILPIMENKRAEAFRVSTKPSLDDAVWQNIPVNRLEKISGGRAAVAASFQAAWDDKNIYLRFTAESPNLNQKKLLSTGRGNYIADENFDIFINPTGLSNRYFQFILSPAPNSFLAGNMNVGRHGADPTWGKLDTAWPCNWTYSLRVDLPQNTWHALLTIPVKSLHGFRPQIGKSLTMNVGRVCDHQLLLWSPNPESASSFRNPEAFGTLQFK